MATQPTDPNPDSVPPETPPPSVPDEIVPPGEGDYDQPDSAPNEDPGSPGKSPGVE